MNTPIMQGQGLRRVYPEADKNDPRIVLDVESIDLFSGEILGIMGHNGCGKSTLLRMLALLEPPDSGSLFLDGQPAQCSDLGQRRQVTLLLQTPYLLSRSVEANVAYGLELRHAPDRRARVDAALEAVGLDPARFRTRRRYELSGGEAQRVALAARLAILPRILLMDEPTASVDEHSAELIALAARKAAALGTSVVIVSHERDWLEPLADRLLVMRGGRIVEQRCGGGAGSAAKGAVGH